ncbi:hypothetical protein ONA91_35525 [Micromonospora sp. DR5-3]|uniref:hypothetical protein n=1 Tax=unclassified Micromonospora TaxID=2617518 RepID=UPI0011D9FC4D|nr:MULTISPECIES: hypothetical protein [unclassified Micromonospora]MCW3819760.1 hypothetical protein [Micromonospora sp. DR5-3]TYC19276.1 hypothetical protein FXF52_37425 [Micromonospora sp. MP36]
MGVLYDYFVAASDDEAASMIEDGPDGELLVLELKGLDPLRLVDVESLLTGVSLNAICERAPFLRVIAALNNDHQLVLSLNDKLRDALARATAEELTAVAAPWAETTGCVQQEDIDALKDLLREFAMLAREARADRAHLYCWVCV